MNKKGFFLFAIVLLGFVAQSSAQQASLAALDSSASMAPWVLNSDHPDYGVEIEKIKNRIDRIKEESDHVRKNIESLNQSIAGLQSGQQDSGQATLSFIQTSVAQLKERLAFIQQDQQDLNGQLGQALSQIQSLINTVNQGQPVTAATIQQQAPIAAAPVTDLFVPASQAGKKGRKGKRGKRAGAARKGASRKSASKKKVAKKKSSRRGALKKGRTARSSAVKK